VAYTNNPGNVPNGSVQFYDGSTILGTVNLNSTGSASMTLNTLALGVHSMIASYLPSDQSTPSESSVANLTVYATAPDMTLSLSSGSLTMSSGSTSSAVALRAASKYGLAGTLTFSCTGLPLGMNCNFTPARTTIAAGGTVSTSVTIVSAANSAASVGSRGVGILLLAPTLLCLARMRRAGKRLRGAMLALTLALIVMPLTMVTGCGSAPTPHSNTSTVLITATNGTVTRNIPLTVTVQ
jgi:hypothetical protein